MWCYRRGLRCAGRAHRDAQTEETLPFQFYFSPWSFVEFPPSRRLSRCILSHADFHSGATKSLSLPHATSSSVSCTTPTSPSCTSTTSPPTALGTPRGRARGCRCRPATLWPGAGTQCSCFSGYVVFARAVGMFRARDACCATEPRCSFPHDLPRRTAPCSARSCRVRSAPHLLLSPPAAAECLRAFCSTTR